jgi:hypothetical protein
VQFQFGHCRTVQCIDPADSNALKVHSLLHASCAALHNNVLLQASRFLRGAVVRRQADVLLAVRVQKDMPAMFLSCVSG